MTHRSRWTAGLIAMGCVAPTCVLASTITLQATGTVTSFTDPQGVLGIAAKAGDTLTLDYTFDTSVPGTRAPDFATQFNGAIEAASYRINNGTAISLNVADPALNAIQYQTSAYPISEGYSAGAGGPAGAANPISFDVFVDVIAETSQASPQLITGNSLQDTPAFTKYLGSGFPYSTDATMQLFQGRSLLLDSSISGVSVVPIPPAFWLFGTGLFGMLMCARQRPPSRQFQHA